MANQGAMMQAAVELCGSDVDGSRLARYRVAKRALDCLGAAILLVMLLPAFVICAVMIKLDSPGPVLFRQERVGRHGKRFTMIKLRTMYTNVDAAPHREYAAAFVLGNAEKRTDGRRSMYKLTDDPRVTRAGHWLRRTSIDELPQLWNVLCGDMSLVGPRPALVYETEHYQPSHLVRLSVKPGITGLWQISGRSGTTFEEMVTLDTTYIQRQSFTFDLRILLKTIPVVISMKDAS